MREPGASEVLICGCTTTPPPTPFLASSPAASNTPGLEVLVQLVMAAISTSPLPTVMPRSPLPALLPCAPSRRRATRWGGRPAGRAGGSGGGGGRRPGRAIEAVVRIGLAEQPGKLAADLAQFDAVLRPLGACQAGRDAAQV